MGRDNDIVKIELVKNLEVKNIHNDFITPVNAMIYVYYRNGEKRIVDLFSELDITDIDYYMILQTKKTKTRLLFEEFER